MYMDPAYSIIAKLGGADAVAVATGKSRTRVYRWTYPVERGGTGGVIPTKSARRLLKHARTNRIALTEAEFLAEPSPVTTVVAA